jgi:hypothetical protein
VTTPPSVARLGALVDTDLHDPDADWRRMSFSVEQSAILSDGRRLADPR